MKVPIILQARVGSTRLPGKVLKEILGKPMLYYIIERLKLAKNSTVILAIPDTEEDSELCKIAKQLDVDCIKGSELDVLGRYYMVSKLYPSHFYIRATADNPLVDFESAERLINFMLTHNVDYAVEKGMPKGGAVEIFTDKALELSHKLAVEERHREHVTLFMKEEERLFNCAYPSVPKELYYPNLSITVDYKEEFDFAKRIYEKFYKEGKPFRLIKIIDKIAEEANLEKR